MSQMLLKIFVVAVACMSYLNVSAQFTKPDMAMIPTSSASVSVDGSADEAVWAELTAYPIDRAFADGPQAPTSTDDCSGTWKAFWDGTDMMYVLVEVTDDSNQPGDGQNEPWTFDKVEVYFDANVGNLADGTGPSAGGTSGHWQFVCQADATLGPAEATAGITTNGVIVTGNTYAVEMSINLASVTSAGGTALATEVGNVFGFDVTIIDNDTGNPGERGRIGWSNDASASNENWLSMDNAGEASLSTQGTTSIRDFSANAVGFYPNPVSSVLSLTEQVQQAQIATVVGQTVMVVKNANTVDVSGLQNGVYLITTTDRNGAVSTAKFMKN